MAEPTPPAAASRAASAQATPLTGFNPKDLSDLSVPESDEQWKDYHDYEAWHLENKRPMKNPFDHQAFVKKGEKISTYEDLMVVTFKTLSKALEMKCEVKGLVSHGLMMS